MAKGVFEDLTGQKFGKLTVIRRAKNRGHNTYWLCKCECGNFKEAQSSNLKSGSSYSCGCERKRKLKIAFTTHNKTKTRLYGIWSHIKQRCLNPKCPSYIYYGERNIKICTNWQNDFMAFYNWSISNGYKDNLTIDRINVNGNYEPSNCRWITGFKQQSNKRNNRYITYNGETHCISEWARIKSIKTITLFKRISNGWTIERALTTP